MPKKVRQQAPFFAGAETPAKAYVNPEQTVGDHFKRIGVETARGPQLPLLHMV